MPYFIKRAVKHPGALRATTKREYGMAGFTRHGTIRVGTLHRLAKQGGKTGQRARFALQLRKFNR